MSYTLNWMSHQAHQLHFSARRAGDPEMAARFGYSADVTVSRDTPVGRIAVVVRTFGTGWWGDSGMQRHTRESWKLDGKRIAAATLAARLEPFEVRQDEGAPLDQERRPLGVPVDA